MSDDLTLVGEGTIEAKPRTITLTGWLTWDEADPEAWPSIFFDYGSRGSRPNVAGTRRAERVSVVVRLP